MGKAAQTVKDRYDRPKGPYTLYRSGRTGAGKERVIGERHFHWSLGIVLIMAAVIFIAAVLSVRSWARDIHHRQTGHSPVSSAQ